MWSSSKTLDLVKTFCRYYSVWNSTVASRFQLVNKIDSEPELSYIYSTHLSTLPELHVSSTIQRPPMDADVIVLC